MQQLEFGQELIETVCIRPTKAIPLEVFKACHRLGYYIELMERIDDNHVIWDENVTDIYSESMAEAEYIGLQNDWFSVDFELPKKFVDEHLKA